MQIIIATRMPHNPFLRFARNDLQVIANLAGNRSLWRHISSAEIDMIGLCIRSLSKHAYQQAQSGSATTHLQIKEILDLTESVEEQLKLIDASANIIPSKLAIVQGNCCACPVKILRSDS